MRADQHVTWPGVLLRVITGCLGAGMILLPAPELPGRAWLLIPAGLLLVVASLAGPLARWRALGYDAALPSEAGGDDADDSSADAPDETGGDDGSASDAPVDAPAPKDGGSG